MAQTGRFGSTGAKPLQVEVTWADAGTPVLLGRMHHDVLCSACLVDILEAFDGGAGITVGGMADPARLQVLTDNHPEVVDFYETEPHFAYSATTNVYVFLSGSPTAGRARVIVYLG